MTPESGTLAPTAAPTAIPAKQKKKGIDQRFIPPFFITLILLTADLMFGVLESPWMTGLAIVVSILTEIVLGKFVTGKIPHLASAYITGISVGILVRSPDVEPFVLCSMISIASKYVLRVGNRHIWNPSNFGIAVMLLLYQHMASLSIQGGNDWRSLAVIWLPGAMIIWNLKRFHICLTFALSFLALAGFRSLVTGHPYMAEVGPITGPMYQLFIFFMITDPKTTVTGKKAQMFVAFLVAVAECGFRLAQNVHAPYFALFTVGPIANLVEIWWQKREKAAKAAAQPIP
jgi:Na+-transporting NADH:ubiquinone oxidoreductase subunit NqrB